MGPWGGDLEEGSGARGGQLCLGKHCPYCPLLHPSYAYIEFATESSAQAAVELDKSIFRGRVIKVCVTARRGGGVGRVARTHSCPSLALCQSLVFGHICWTAGGGFLPDPDLTCRGRCWLD